MQLYNVIDLSKLGEMDEKWGQSYWGKDDNDKNIKFNSMNEDITAPCTISAEETTSKTSSKGTPYLQLKKVKVAEKGSQTVLPPAAVDETGVTPHDIPAQPQLDRIESLLQEIDSKLDKLSYEPVVEPDD